MMWLKIKKVCNKNLVKLSILGSIAGILSGLFASGGGTILIPMLIHFFNISEKESRADTIFCVLPMVISSVLLYKRAQCIDWKISLFCAIGGVLGGIIGTKILSKINDKYLSIIFIVFVIYSATLMLIN